MSKSNHPSSVHYFVEDLDFNLSQEKNYTEWVRKIVAVNTAEIGVINFIFCSNAYLLGINQEYLSHDYYTDIISFPYTELPDPLEGDIFISIEMVKENALNNSVTFQEELRRVMAHGLLHFLGFKDKTPAEISTMRDKEEEMMALFVE